MLTYSIAAESANDGLRRAQINGMHKQMHKLHLGRNWQASVFKWLLEGVCPHAGKRLHMQVWKQLKYVLTVTNPCLASLLKIHFPSRVRQIFHLTCLI